MSEDTEPGIPQSQLNDTRVAPFNTLPFEITSQIFKNAYYSNYTRENLPTYELQRFPLILAKVCSLWRKIVFATPQLWSYFQMEVSTYFKRSLTPELFQLYLDNNGNLPFTLRLYFDDGESGLATRDIDPVFFTLCQMRNIHKVYSLELLYIRHRELREFSGLSGVGKLDITLSSIDYDESPVDRLILPDLPRLQHVKVTGSKTRVVTLPKTVTSLSLEKASVGMCFSVLHRSPGLTAFHCFKPFQGYHLQHIFDLPPVGPLCMSRLEDLTWSYRPYPHYSQILPRLELPALRRFSWYSPLDTSRADEREEEDITLQSFIPSLPPTLSHLEIYGARGRERWGAHLKHIFNQAPALQRLDFSYSDQHLITDVLSMLFCGQSVDGKQEVCLPSLQLVVCSSPPVFWGEEALFADCIAQIYDDFGKLRDPGKEFVLEISRIDVWWGRQMYRTCQKLRKQGFSCRLIPNGT